MLKSFILLITLLPFSVIQAQTLTNKFILTEKEKINLLINYVSKLDGKFIRNGEEYTAQQAADHLEFKLNKAGNKISTAKIFIDFIGSKSSISNQPYQVKFSNGSIINLRDLLYNQLRKIETSN